MQSAIDNQIKIKGGYIYNLSNKALSKTYKIGFLKEDFIKRVKGLQYEPLDTDFVIENMEDKKSI